MFEDLFPIDWNAFHFLRPQFLWLLMPVALVLLFGLLTLRQEVRWKKVIAPHLRPYVIQKGSQGVKIFMQVILFLALSLGVLGLAGPAWKKVELPGQQLKTPLVILLDLSQSMLADDLDPNRLERAKFKIRDLFDHNPRARTGLIGFAGTAHTIVPLSRDYDIILSHIDGLSPSVMPFPGSDLESALAMADTMIAGTEAPGTVLILSDDFSEAQVEWFGRFTDTSENKIDILPMNTPSGGTVPGVRDADGNPVISALNRQALSRLASLERVQVHSLTLDDSDMQGIAGAISDNLLFTEEPEEKEDDWRDAGLLPVIPMAFLVLFWFRKGWVLFSLSLILLSSCSDGRRFEDYWFTRDYQGQRLSDQGEYEEAAERYEDPLRKGVAFYKAEDYEAAVNAFSQDTTALGAYNLGLAYYKNGDYAAAEMAFGQAVEMDPQLEQARQSQQQVSRLRAGIAELDPEEAQEAGNTPGPADNIENQDMEDLGGGGQEATEEDMQKQRKEETVATDIRKGKELEEVPDNIGAVTQANNSKVLMRKVDDDPTLFLKRKFAYQVKKKNIKPKSNEKKW